MRTMKNVNKSWKPSLCTIAAALLLFSCGKPSSEKTFSALSREAYIEHAIPVEEVLTLEESDEVFFGTIGSLATDSRGNIFVVDRQANHVIRFNPDGDLVATFGREGEGPGEFRYMSNMFVSRDTLYIYDFQNARLTSLTYDASGPLTMNRVLDIQIQEGRIPRGVLMARDKFLVEGFTTDETGQQQGFVALLNHDGSLNNANFMPLRAPETFPIRFMDRDMHLPRPFRRLSHYRVTSDDLFYYAWNDSLRVQVYDMQGRVVNTIGYDIEYRTANPSDFDKSRYPRELSSFFDDAMPATRPAFDNMMVDDTGRVWVNLGDIADPDTDQWIILNKESRLEGTFELPRRVRFFQVVGNRIYGIDRDEEGYQRIKVYAVG
jgi:hypothetical protein